MIFGEYENALKQFEKAKELHFTPIETYIEMGKYLIQLGRDEEAVENLKKGKYLAAHSVKSSILGEDDKRITIDDSKTQLIEEANKYIEKLEKKK